MGEEVEFEKMLLTNGAVLEIIVSKSIWGNIEWELIVSIALLTESENSYFNKSIIKSSVQKILLQDFFCSFNNDGELKSFCKIIYLECKMLIYSTYYDISWFWADDHYKSWFNFSWMIELYVIP